MWCTVHIDMSCYKSPHCKHNSSISSIAESFLILHSRKRHSFIIFGHTNIICHELSKAEVYLRFGDSPDNLLRSWSCL